MKGQKIIATLAYGKFHGRFVETLLWLLVFGGVFVLGVFIFFAIYNKDYSFLAGLIFAFVLIFGCGYVLNFERKIKKQVNIWLKDSVELSATSKTVDKRSSLFVKKTKAKIGVKFKYNDKYINQISGEKSTLKECIFVKNIGYDSIFCKYADREIKILYSPKYNQVMILKD